MKRSKAWAPGHVTVFFSIHDSADGLARRGSRGAGFCVDAGATATVEMSDDDVMLIDGARTVNKVLSDVVHLARGKRMEPGLTVSIETELPLGQGFGMSGAIALSAAMAITDLLDSGVDPVFAAHSADVLNGTGLGDVVAQSIGGFEMRTVEGIPPHGEITRLPMDVDEVFLAWTERPLSTPRIIMDPDGRRRINEAGHVAMENLSIDPSLENLCRTGREFAEGAGLLGPRVSALIGKRQLAGMCMLGNSAYSFEGMEGAQRLRIGKKARLL
jgi:pantoate kinase